MNNQAQVIYNNDKPAFVVLQYKDYLALTGRQTLSNKPEFVPFVLSEYIKNPVRLKRIEAGLNQKELAKLLGVTQGYISRIESRNFQVPAALLAKVTATISNKRKKTAKKK
jgi:DNA-binding XRE family transcriptional regulator